MMYTTTDPINAQLRIPTEVDRPFRQMWTG